MNSEQHVKPGRQTDQRTNTKKEVGRVGEEMAVAELRQLGLSILELNAHVGRAGEIDIIAQEGEVLVFVEVKTRTGAWMGMPEESVHKQKQRQLKRLARSWIHRHGMYGMEVRFDVVAIEINDHSKELRYLRNAFW